MIEVNPVALFLLGQRIGALEAYWVVPDASFATIWLPWGDMIGGLGLYEREPFSPQGMSRSREAASDLVGEMMGIWEGYEREERQGLRTLGHPIPGGVKDRLLRRLDTFRTHLSGDLKELSLFLVPPRYGYAPTTLLERAGEMFGTAEADVMALAGDDVREAARCMAFGLWTAFGFHFLRACELVMLEYLRVCDKPMERGSWQGYLKALGQIPGVSRQIKRTLDRLTRWDRDELMHPARSLSQLESESLFDDIKAAIREMMIDIRARKLG